MFMTCSRRRERGFVTISLHVQFAEEKGLVTISVRDDFAEERFCDNFVTCSLHRGEGVVTILCININTSKHSQRNTHLEAPKLGALDDSET